MSASCYLCAKRFGTIPGEYVGDAWGACKLCGVLACGAHAIHNRNMPAYLCGICLPNLLAAAAIHQGTTGGPPSPVAPSPAPSVPGGSGYSALAAPIDRLEDVLPYLDDDGWKEFRDDVAYLSRYFVNPDAPDAVRAMADEDERARVLMAGAIALAVHLHLPPTVLVPALQELTVAVRVAR